MTVQIIIAVIIVIIAFCVGLYTEHKMIQKNEKKTNDKYSSGVQEIIDDFKEKHRKLGDFSAEELNSFYDVLKKAQLLDKCTNISVLKDMMESHKVFFAEDEYRKFFEAMACVSFYDEKCCLIKQR